MRKTLLTLACVAAAAALGTLPASGSAEAGFCPPHKKVKHWKRPAPVVHGCRRCYDCAARRLPPARVYAAPIPAPVYYAVPTPVYVPTYYYYTPGVVYQGPYGVYRPYAPVVVYDVPPPVPYYSSWRDDRRWHWRW